MTSNSTDVLTVERSSSTLANTASAIRYSLHPSHCSTGNCFRMTIVQSSGRLTILLSPIFDDGHRLIFEFQRAHILSVNRRDDLETRLVAVHPALGIVGTKTVHRFNTRWSALATRCGEHLAGGVDLFPARERPTRTSRIQIPVGEANLTFESGTKSLPRRDVESQHEAWSGIAGTLPGQEDV